MVGDLPSDGEWAQRDTTLKLIVIHVAETQVGVDVDNLWQTIQPGPFSKNQADQLQAAVLLSYSMGIEVD